VRAPQETTAPLAVLAHLVLLVQLEAFALAVLPFRKVALVRRETTVLLVVLLEPGSRARVACIAQDGRPNPSCAQQGTTASRDQLHRRNFPVYVHQVLIVLQAAVPYPHAPHVRQVSTVAMVARRSRNPAPRGTIAPLDPRCLIRLHAIAPRAASALLEACLYWACNAVPEATAVVVQINLWLAVVSRGISVPPVVLWDLLVCRVFRDHSALEQWRSQYCVAQGTTVWRDRIRQRNFPVRVCRVRIVLQAAAARLLLVFRVLQGCTA
jgi:hypothetical protein